MFHDPLILIREDVSHLLPLTGEDVSGAVSRAISLGQKAGVVALLDDDKGDGRAVALLQIRAGLRS